VAASAALGNLRRRLFSNFFEDGMSHTPQDFDKAVERLPELDKQIAELLAKRVDQSEAYEWLVEAVNEQRTKSQ
jgi:hypothetical protein